jgi:hypothetical protein
VILKPESEELNSHCSVDLIPPKQTVMEQKDILFSPRSNDLCKNLNSGTRIDISFTVRPHIKNDVSLKEETVTLCRLGAVSIEWSPTPLHIPTGITINKEDQFRDYHGALPIKQPKSLRQKGPSCYVEVTPFATSFRTIPAMPQVGNPFEIRYEIVNRTSLHQRLRVLMNDSDAISASNSMLVSGIINGEIVLGPLEKKILSYSILVTKVGNITTPAFDVSSVRYNSWIVHGSNKIFVSP